MTICENCHGLFFQTGLTGHIVSVDPKTCTICRESVRRTAQCDCELPLLNIMQLCRALFGHILSLEVRMPTEKGQEVPKLWKPGRAKS